MEDSKILIDTNVLIEYLRSKDKSSTTLLKYISCKLYISTITIFELYAGADTNEKQSDVTNLVKEMKEFIFMKMKQYMLQNYLKF
ncbi:MAG: PIN domain-containing protein [Ignavibacteria bacterium]|nr:PIN domain-containing protein [Ignavibacteria bacterium]